MIVRAINLNHPASARSLSFSCIQMILIMRYRRELREIQCKHGQFKLSHSFRLKQDDFKTPLLQSVYEGDQSTLDADLEMTKRTQFTYKYEHDLMLVFWLAVHLENLEIAQALVKKELLIKKIVASITVKNSQNSKKSSIEMIDSRGDSYQSQSRAGAQNSQSQYSKHGSSNAYSNSSKHQRQPPVFNNDYGDEEVFESQNLSSNNSQQQIQSKDSGSSNKSSFMQSSSSSEISKSLQNKYEEQRRLKKRQQELRQQNQLFEGGDKDRSKRRKSKKRSGRQKEAEEEKRSSSSNEVLPIRGISNYQDVTINVIMNKKNSGNARNHSMQYPSQSQGKLKAGMNQELIQSNQQSTGGRKQKKGLNEEQSNLQMSSHLNENSQSQSSHQIIQANIGNKQAEKTLGQVLRELKQAQQEETIRRVSNKNSELDFYLSQQGVTLEQVERVEFITMDDLLRLKQHFKNDSTTVMTHILKLAISMGEYKLTWIITLDYEITIEEEMFANAIFTENYQWLFFVWAARKNFIGNRKEQKASFITFEQLFEMILKISKDGKFGERNRVERNIKRVLDWKIQSDENINNNIIRCLLAHHLDIMAVDYMGVYNKLLNKDLLIYCIDHGNIYFLRNALLLAAFDKMLFREDLVILELLTILKRGYSTNFILNILSLIDISVWKNKRLKTLIETINDYVDEKYSRNRLLLSPNPLMSISIACELLSKIADARRKFESECFQIQQELLKLGQMYTKKIEDETYYESILMTKDFSERNLIKIITQNSFEKLMEEKDPKAERVMMMIWRGKEAAHCDGDIFGYSNLVHVIMSKPKKIMERNKSEFMQIVTNFFEMNTKMNYSFQYRFRIESIQFYFYKEFLCAFLMLIIFQYVNYRYLILFSNKIIKGIDEEIVFGNQTYSVEIQNTTDSYDYNLQRVRESVKDYIGWNFWVIFFSAALIFQHLLKVLFNINSNLKIGLDKWTVMDVLSATLNIIAMVLINQIDPGMFLQPRVKDLIDYFMLLVLTVSWLRFFSYYLVVRSISKLLLTLIEMIGDTLSFLFIVSCFILIMSSIFATLYQDNYPEKYGGLAKTVTTLFNGVVAQYSYDDEEMKGRVISHSVLTITHVFFTNIILMNYLIAILSSTYGKMKESGIFSFKVNLYQYCERYLIAFKDRDYGELVMHPPPLAFIVGLIIPFSCSRIFMAKLSKWMSYLMYWLENIVYLVVFFIFELIVSPIAYIKIWYNLFLIVRTTGIGTTGLVKGGIYCLVWAFLGPFIMIWIQLMDLRNFMVILINHDGFTRTKQEKIAANRADDTLKLQLYNETRAVVISLYQRITRLIAKESLVQQTPYPNIEELTQDESSDEDDFERIPDFFIIEEQQQINMSSINDEQHYFLLRKTLIIEEWKKRRLMIERKIRLKQNDFSSSGDASNNRLDMLTKTLRRGMKNKQDYFTKERQRRQSTPFIHWEKTTLNLQKQKQQSKNARGDVTTHIKGAILEKITMTMQKKVNEEDKVDMTDFVVPEDEVAVVDQFLSKFSIMPESGQRDIIDIKLMINALPNRIMNYGLETVEMFNFRIFQESLHAYQNLDMVKVFEFFDKKNKERIQIVRNRILYQKELIADSNDLLDKVIEKFEASPSLTAIPNSFEAAELKKKWMLQRQQTINNNPPKKSTDHAFNRMNSINYGGAAAQRSTSNNATSGGVVGSSSNNNLSPGDESTTHNISNMRRSSQNNSVGTTSQRNADTRARNMFQPTAN